jgi:hypothetical protein
MPPVHKDDADDEMGGSSLEPRVAAELMGRSAHEADNELDVRPPVAMVAMAIVVLGAFVVLWLSTRGQHPYTGPNGGVIALTYGVVFLTAVIAARIYRKAMSGVSGASIRQQRIEGVALAASVLGSPAIQRAMYHYHASDAIVYGVIPAAGPLIIIGTTLLGIAGAKSDWPQFGAALALVTAGVVALFVGPSGAWLVAGIGVFAAVTSFSIARAKRRGRERFTWVPASSTR